MCGVFGIRSSDRDVARLTYFGLFALQHRGQESAGIAVSNGGRLTVLREMGLVAHVFDEEKLQALPGDVAIGHARYSTTGSSRWSNAQPLVQHGRARTVALGHNGNLTNSGELRAALAAERIALGTTSDTEAIGALIAHDDSPLPQAVARAMARLEGAYSVVLLSEGKLVGFRDPHGIRPLALGRLANEQGGDDWVLASETCALDLIGARFEREVRPGEVVTITEDGLESLQALPEGTAGALHLRARLLRPARLDARGLRGARRSPSDGRAARRRGARRGRPRDADPRLRHAGCRRLRARVGNPVHRGADQEPLRRPHLHRARPGPARAGDQAQVQPPRRGERQAARDHRRLDRPRLDDASARRDARRRRREKRCTCGSPRPRSCRPATTGSTSRTSSSSPRRTARPRSCAS